MKIGELAKRTDTPASTIRYYEQQGLLPKTKRGSNGYREYDEGALERLQLIKFSQRLGFALGELPSLIDGEGGWDHERVIGHLQRKQQDISIMIATLQKQQTQITDLVNTLGAVWHKGECLPTDELAKILKNAPL